MALRRHFARRARARQQGAWPIHLGSERTPRNWPGWPEGKRFALVLTHDVESAVGAGRCRAVMAIEKELGFRSSFNLIPEGSYAVSPALLEEIKLSGGEVGVHDLRHDGTLYRSKADFDRGAPVINRYLKAWQASGFRGAFMHHNLDWLHQLHIQYDASTFDTDPFEPQPQGVYTIFPFWVPAPPAEARGPAFAVPGAKSDVQPTALGDSELGDRKSERTAALPRPGYVELPYTLPQDSTLFLLFREPTIEIWRTKLDWVAQHGGMALLNVHPDYLRFGDAPASPKEYPALHYHTFLRYVRNRYQGEFWHALPSEVSSYFRAASGCDRSVATIAAS
jgi:hypothetical protein